MKNILFLAAFLVSLHSIAQVPSYVPTNGIVAFWPFDGNANDISGNGNNGVNNGATVTSGHDGGPSDAFYFSATNCNPISPLANPPYVGVNINTAPINSSGAMTLSFWIYRVGNGCQGSRAMEFGSCATCAGQILVTWVNGNNPITFRHYLTTTNFLTYNFNATASNTWYHIVYTNDGTTAKFYLNGVLVNSVASPAPVQLLGNAAFGRMNHPNYDAINGNLDDIGLWSRSLTSCEVNNLYVGNTSASFSINPLPDTTFMCDSIKLDAGAGYNSYSWNDNATTETITAQTQGLYKVTVTNTSGCRASDSTYVTTLKPTISQKDTSICRGSSIMLNATGIAPSQTLVDSFFMNVEAPYSHIVNTVIGANYVMEVDSVWSIHLCPGNGDLLNQTDAAFYYQRNPITEVPLSSDLVKWNGVTIYPDGNTYNASHRYTYTLPPATQATENFSFIDPSGPSSYGDNCGGLHFTIYKVNNTNATYTWSAKPSTTAGLNAVDINKQNITVKPTANTTYYITLNNGITGCEDSVQIFIATVDTSLTVSGATTVCGTANVTFTAGTDNSYKWLLNNVAIATNKTYNATQTGTYSVAVANSIGCIDTSRSIAISLYPKPTAGFTINNTSQCLSGNSFVYTNTSTISSGTLSYLWNLGDGQKAISKDTTYTYTAANNSYSVKLVTTSNNGCSDSITQTVVVKPMPSTPTITANGPLGFCAGGNVILSSDTTQGNQWYKNNLSVSGAVSQTYTATTSGNYTVIAVANGCSSNASTPETVTANLTPPTPTVTAQGPVSFCTDGSVEITSDAGNGNQWYQGNNIISGAINQTYTATTAGTYTVIVSATNCPSNTSNGITVTINPTTPTPIITANGPLTFCDNGSVVLSSNAASGNQWYQSGYLLPQASGNTYTVEAAGVYTVIATAPNACPSAFSQGTSINILPSPHGTRYDAINTSANTPTILQARNFGIDYSWIPSTGLTNTTTATPTFNYNTTTDYLIHITTSAGCFTDDTVLVNVYNVKGFLIPTAFTPNGDGLNDILKAFTIDIKQINYFRIFNKWGQLIFETNNSLIGWDGTYQGSPQAIGNYVWIGEGIDNTGRTIDQHGQILLIR